MAGAPLSVTTPKLTAVSLNSTTVCNCGRNCECMERRGGGVLHMWGLVWTCLYERERTFIWQEREVSLVFFLAVKRTNINTVLQNFRKSYSKETYCHFSCKKWNINWTITMKKRPKTFEFETLKTAEWSVVESLQDGCVIKPPITGYCVRILILRVFPLHL